MDIPNREEIETRRKEKKAKKKSRKALGRARKEEPLINAIFLARRDRGV
jgi:hypothetical protein